MLAPRRGNEEANISRGCPRARLSAIAQVTLPRERFPALCVYVYARAYVAARYYRIILGYFTGTQKRVVSRTCANSFTDDRYSLAGENKRKRTEAQSSGGFLRFAWGEAI